jgi:Trk-type K+ transport systems, membrane components
MKIPKLSAYAKWDGPIIHMIGNITGILGTVMLLISIIALYFGEDVKPFLYPGLLCILAAIPMVALFAIEKNLRPADGLLMVTATWLLVIGIGSIPFLMFDFPIVDAIFESASGFTTTGSTIINDVGTLPNSLLLWRSATQWFGGIATILIVISILPMLGIGGKSMLLNETFGSGTKNFTARIKDTAKQFVMIYMGLTIILAVMCIILGAGVLESVCITMSTISTGGFLPVNSMDVYNSAIHLTLMVFMFLGGTNFYLHYRAVYEKDPSVYAKNSEFKTMALWFIAVAVLMFLIITGTTGDAKIVGTTSEEFGNVLFTVVSIGTGTGYVAVDHSIWAAGGALFLIIALMFIGGSSGSTSGGIKIYRGVFMVKYLKNAMQKLIHPRAVFDVKLDGGSIDQDTLSSAVAVVMLFFITLLIGSVVAVIFGHSPMDAFSLVLSSVTNTGSSFSADHGPLDSLSDLSGGMKIFLAILMWLGRLEIIMALVLIMPAFWKEMIRGRARA